MDQNDQKTIKLVVKAALAARSGKKREAAQILQQNNINGDTARKILQRRRLLSNNNEPTINESVFSDIENYMQNQSTSEDIADPASRIDGIRRPGDDFEAGGGPAFEAGKTPKPGDDQSLDPNQIVPPETPPLVPSAVVDPPAQPLLSNQPPPDDSDSGDGSSLGDQVRQQLIDRAKKYLKEKLWDQGLKVVGQRIWAWLLANPYVAAAIGIIILILIVGLGLFAYFTKITPSAGKTPTVATSPVADGNTLNTIKIKSGDPNAHEQATQEVFGSLQTNLANLKNETGDQAIKDQIDQAISLISQYLSTDNPDKGNAALDLIRQILAKLDNNFPQIAGRSPINSNDVVTYNDDLHMGTPLNPGAIDGAKGHGTYIYPAQNKCDAVDIFTKANASVYPVITGDVIDVSNDGTGNKKIVIRNGDYQVLYANITTSLKIGDKITSTTTPIGATTNIGGAYQVHLEFTYCGICLVTTPLDKVTKFLNPNTAWGELLWNHFKYVLKIS